MWSFPACPGSGMERVRLDAIRFFILPYPAASQACVWGMSADPIVPRQFHLQRQSLGDSKGGPHPPLACFLCGVTAFRVEAGALRSVAAQARRLPHPIPRFSFTNPKHRFGFERKNEEADMEFSASAGNGMQRVHSDAGKALPQRQLTKRAPPLKRQDAAMFFDKLRTRPL